MTDGGNYSNRSPSDVLTLEQIYATAAKIKAIQPATGEFTVSPDLLESVQRAIATDGSVLQASYLIHVDNRLPPRTWHKGPPR